MFASVFVFNFINFLLFFLFFWFLFLFFLLFSSLFFSLLNFFWGQFNFFFLLFVLVLFLMLFFLNLFGSVLKIKSDWKLEVKLTGSALMLSSESIEKFEINFWTVESSISFVNFVFFSEFVKSVFKLRFSNFPIFKFTQIFLRSG